MSALDVIKGFMGSPTVQASQPVQPVQPTPGNIPNQQVPTTQQTEVTPANGVIPVQENTPEASPLDAFKDVWNTPTNTNPTAPMFNVDQTKLMEAASKVDFAKVVTPELAARMAKGGDDALKASMEAMSKMSQLSYAQSALATTKIVEQAVQKTQEAVLAQIPDLVRKYQVGDSIRTENPLLNHAATQPIIAALQSQLTQKHPNATVAEINKMTNQYLEAFSSVAVPKKEDTSKQDTKGETDWSTFFG